MFILHFEDDKVVASDFVVGTAATEDKVVANSAHVSDP